MRPRHILYFVAIVILILAMAAMVTGTTEFQSGDLVNSGVIATPTISAVEPIQPQPSIVSQPLQEKKEGSSTCQSWQSGAVNKGSTIQEGTRTLICLGDNRWEYVTTDP